MKQRMEIEEAISIVTANAYQIKDEITVSLDEAYGHILAHDLAAHCNVPSFARSAMDGYAVKAVDTEGASRENPVRLKVLSEILAGDAAAHGYEAKTAVRIMTGGMIPDGYDAVIRQEDTDLGEDEVEIFTPARRYMNYCHAGEEIQSGTLVLKAGRRLGRIEIGLIASLGLNKVSVVRPIKVAIISTGSELVKPGDALPQGCIYGNIRHMLAASVQSEGFIVSYAEDCKDDFDVIRDHIVKAAETADV
nr:molybdopterin molybdotransferase MoeA [Lachnospiraceae bacterium]